MDGSPRRIGGWSQTHTFTPADRPSILNCTWQNFTQKVDHFGDNPGTFPQRVCLYSQWWKSPSNNTFNAPDGAPGPILFYTGNESPVDEYVNNTGLMWELGEQLGALLVFAEHRYEPLSHPALCGLGSQRCFAYCTTAQAIADWVTIIASLRTQHAVRAPVVAFGGSYGGMLAGWFRMKYPDVVDGVIAASAPIWQLAGTVRRETLDMQAVAITRGVSAAGGATDQCRDNLRAAWPLIQQVGRTRRGRQLLSAHVGACHEIGNADDLNRWAQQPYFFMAEGNYPFESTYITYSVVPGKAYPLPAWPMRVACGGGYGGGGGLNADFGVKLTGSVADVKYSLALGDISVDVDWKTGTGNGDKLTEAQINASGVLELAAAVAAAAGVWHNLTKDVKCYNISNGDATTAAPHHSEHDGHQEPHFVAPPAAAARRLEAAAAANDGVEAPATQAKSCPACPPCDDCPPCPVSFCDYEDDAPCTFTGELSRGFSWGGICCNDALSQIDITGVGRDFFWPPQVPARNYTVESIVGPKQITPGGCANQAGGKLRGGPLITDRWSTWMEAYYGSRDDIGRHTNIVWSNGALDPWSGQGVYPPGGGPGGPMVQNVSADGSQISLMLDLGAHHLDLMFSHPSNPPCFAKARAIEEERIKAWIQEAYDAV